MMISNQYQINFKGNLIKKGIVIPEKKFNEVAQIYKKQTKGLPDLTLSGKRENDDWDGQFIHLTNAIINGEEFEVLSTGALKRAFKEFSPKAVAKELVNITKRYITKEKASHLSAEIESLKYKIENIGIQLKHTKDAKYSNRLKVISERMNTTLTKKEEEYAKLKEDINKLTNEWCSE